jgi:hypothetical protein
MVSIHSKFVITLTAFELSIQMKIMYHKHGISNYGLEIFVIRFSANKFKRDGSNQL